MKKKQRKCFIGDQGLELLFFFDICVAMYTLDPDFYCIFVYIRHSFIFIVIPTEHCTVRANVKKSKYC